VLLDGLAGGCADCGEVVWGGEGGIEGGYEGLGGADVAQETVCAVGDDIGAAAGGVGEGGDGAGHGFEEGVGEAFVDRGDDEEIEGAVPWEGILLETGHVDARGMGACGYAAGHGLLRGAAAADEDEVQIAADGLKPLEGIDEVEVALEFAITADQSEYERVRREAGLGAGLGTRAGGESGGIHALETVWTRRTRP